MEAKFISKSGRDFTIEIDGVPYSSVIPVGMEGKEDEAIAAFATGKIWELQQGEAVTAEPSYSEGEVILTLQ